MKKTITVIVSALMLLPLAASAKAKKKTKVQPLPVPTIEIVKKVNDKWQVTNSPKVRSFWDDAAYFTGNMEAYKLTGCARYLEFSDKWARHNHWSGATEKDHSKWLYKNYGESMQHVLFGDWQICFQTYLDMYEMNPDPYKIERAKEVMGYMVNSKENDYWWWADALYMVMPVFTKLYKATGDVKYLDKLYDNLIYADKLMFDAEAKLYFRDGRYVYPKHKTDLGKKDFWARGNGWVLAGLAKVLADMPECYKHRDFFLQRYLQLAEGVASCQQKEGHWTRSMLDPEQAEGYETSGTAFFAYGFYWGMNHGLLDRVKYQPVADLAWKYLSETALQPDGTVGYVQPIGDRAIKGQFLGVKNVTNFGTGAFLLAACERVRFEDATVNPDDNKAFKVVVNNNSDIQRQEVVEIEAKEVYSRLGIQGGRQFVVTNALGQQVPYQLTYDGKLLVEAAVRPKGKTVFTIAKGEPTLYRNTCYGRMYPERVDDIAWENDRAAYRCYGPALQKSGERAFGNDVWLKNTPELVVEQRYFVEDTTKPIIAELKKKDPAKAKALEMKTSYHYDHGNGLDCYKVGPTLGCGAPAILEGDDLVYPYCYTSYELLDNGPLRFTVRLDYGETTLKNGDKAIEHRVLSLDKGRHLNRMTVSYSGITQPVDVCSGVVIHSEDTESVMLDNHAVLYADPTDNPQGQNFQIYVGAFFPGEGITTCKKMFDEPKNGAAGHALGVKKGLKADEPFTYYFGSAWSKYDCRNMLEWTARMGLESESINNPLKVTIE